MPDHRSFLQLLGLGLVLSACGGSPAPGTTGSGSAQQVTLHLDFPAATSSQRVHARGVSGQITSAKILVYDEAAAATVSSVTLTPQNSSAAILLASNKSYRFETSALNGSTELAWGKFSHNVTSNETLDLPVTSIVKTASLIEGTQPTAGGNVAVSLSVNGPLGDLIPQSDYNVTYNVQNGSVVSESKLGAVIKPAASGAVSVTASVQGQGEKHTVTTLTAAKTFTPVVQAPTLWYGAVSGTWPIDYDFPMTLLGEFSLSGKTQRFPVGSVQNGSVSLSLPDVRDLTSPFTFEGRSCTSADAAGNFGALVLTDFPLYGGANTSGRVGNSKLYLSSTYYEGRLVYADRAVKGTYSYTCQNGNYPVTYTMALDLAAGWNVLQYNSGGQWQGTPLTDTLPSNTSWKLYDNTYLTDLSLSGTVDVTAPYVGSTVTYTINVTNNGPETSGWLSVRNILPAGLSSVSFTSSQGSFSATDNTWYLSNLSSGQAATLSVSAKVSSGNGTVSSAPFIDLGSSSYTFDKNTANNRADIALNVQPQPGQSNAVGARLDTTVPTVTLSDLSSVQSSAPVTVTGTVRDTAYSWYDGSVYSSGLQKVELYAGPQLVATVLAANFSSGSDAQQFKWSSSWTPSQAGLVRLTALGYDNAGNVGRSEVIVNVP